MIHVHSLSLAPWVVKKDNVLLGSKLNAIRVTHLDFSTIPPSNLDYLIRNNYITGEICQKNVGDINDPLFHISNIKGSDKQFNWIWASDSSFLGVAHLLKKSLSLFDFSYPWKVATDKSIVLENLKNNDPRKSFIIRLSHREPIGERAIENLYADLIGKIQIIWLGETTEGMHIGPIIQTSSNLEKYLFSTKNWYFSKKLIEFGFKDYWPLLIYPHLLSDSHRVAEAISRLASSPPETCFLIEENREVCLWTKLTEKKISESEFFRTQFWSKGLIRNFQIDQFDFTNGAYIAKCRSPCKSSDYLEGNSGKGIDLTRATYSLVGESIERFSALQSNKKITKLNKPREIKKYVYDISQFHPFGPKWEKYLATPKIELPLCKVKDEINPNSICFVPECLIPFPYEAPDPQYDVTTSSTGGLAVYSSYKQAVIKGSLELFERNDFYNFFLFQKVGYTLDFSGISSLSKTPLYNFTVLLNDLENNQLQYWCIVYNLNSTLPIVHCLILDQKNNFFSRGSGSGYTLLEAASSALVEALQIRQQFLKNDNNQASKGHQDWRTPIVVEEIQSYLEEFQTLRFSDHPINAIQYSTDLLLDEIKNNVGALQQPLLVADLPCPIIGWFAVRVLIPGFTSHQYPSETLGGKKLINPVFKHGIPT